MKTLKSLLQWTTLGLVTLAISTWLARTLSPMSLMDEIFYYVENAYYRELDMEECQKLTLARGLSACTDRYTRYLPPMEARQENAENEGKFGGLGVRITRQKNKTGGQITVEMVTSGNSAEKAGIREGDVLVAVSNHLDGKKGISLEDIPLEEAVDILRGPVGSKIFLTVRRKSKLIVIPIERAEIKINSVFAKKIQDQIGYIQITQFTTRTPEEVSDALKKLNTSRTKVLIIDVRNNPGGILDSVLNVISFFAKEPFQEEAVYIKRRGREAAPYNNNAALLKLAKAVLKMASKNGPKQAAQDWENYRNLKVIALTNRGSASASEILAGWFKEYSGAEVVGEKTYGKGLVQSRIKLRGGGQLWITTSEYFLGNKQIKINGRGVSPTLQVTDDPATAEDEQLEAAIRIGERLLSR